MGNLNGPDLSVVEDGEDGGDLGSGEVGEKEADHVLLLPRVQAGHQERARRCQHRSVGPQPITTSHKQKSYKLSFSLLIAERSCENKYKSLRDFIDGINEKC